MAKKATSANIIGAELDTSDKAKPGTSKPLWVARASAAPARRRRRQTDLEGKKYGDNRYATD